MPLVRLATGAAPDICQILASGLGGMSRPIFGHQVDRAPAVLTSLTRLRLARGLAATFVAERDDEEGRLARWLFGIEAWLCVVKPLSGRDG